MVLVSHRENLACYIQNNEDISNDLQSSRDKSTTDCDDILEDCNSSKHNKVDCMKNRNVYCNLSSLVSFSIPTSSSFFIYYYDKMKWRKDKKCSVESLNNIEDKSMNKDFFDPIYRRSISKTVPASKENFHQIQSTCVSNERIMTSECRLSSSSVNIVMSEREQKSCGLYDSSKTSTSNCSLQCTKACKFNAGSNKHQGNNNHLTSSGISLQGNLCERKRCTSSRVNGSGGFSFWRHWMFLVIFATLW